MSQVSQVSGAVFLCNIKPLIYFHVFGGVYHAITESKILCVLIRLYCLIISVTFISCIIYCTLTALPLKLIVFLVEYVGYVVFGLYCKDTYLYLRATSVDDVKKAKETFEHKLQTIFITIASITIVLQIISAIVFCNEYNSIYKYVCRNDVFCNLSPNCIRTCIFFARFQFIYMFAVLYYRVKYMRTCLENSTGRLSMMTYIRIYETIADGFKEHYKFLQPMVSRIGTN